MLSTVQAIPHTTGLTHQNYSLSFWPNCSDDSDEMPFLNAKSMSEFYENANQKY